MIKRSLTLSEVRTIARQPADLCLLTFYETVIPDFDQVDQIDPCRVFVSDRFWLWLCDRLQSGYTDPNVRISLGWLMVNKGPASSSGLTGLQVEVHDAAYR